MWLHRGLGTPQWAPRVAAPRERRAGPDHALGLGGGHYWNVLNGDEGPSTDPLGSTTPSRMLQRISHNERVTHARPPVLSETDLDWSECGPDGRTFRRKQLGAAAEGEQLGASLYELPPGRSAWRPHYHAGNEEPLYVLGGEGVVRVGSAGDEPDTGSGNCVALSRGEAGFHNIRAGDEMLRYLMVSTMEEPDITVFPEGGRWACMRGHRRARPRRSDAVHVS